MHCEFVLAQEVHALLVKVGSHSIEYKTEHVRRELTNRPVRDVVAS